jgi:hypothetical protein
MITKITELLLKKNGINTMKLWSQKSFRIPGLIFILVLILKNPFIACSNPNSSFYNKILNDFDTTSYFIALDIKSPYYKGRTIIENNNLYMYLHKSKGFDKEKYIDFMKSTLRHHRALKIKDKDLVRQKFIKVDVLESVIYNANKGSDNFISKYFNGTVLNFGITEKEQNAIINQLFFWDIPAKIEKLTGELIIG